MSSRSRTKRCTRSSSGLATLGSALSHPRQRLGDGRAHRSAADTEGIRDFLLREAEVVVRDDDRSLPFGEEREEPTHFESLQDRGGQIVRGELRHARLADGPQQAAPCLSQGDSIEPALWIAVIRRWVAQSFLEGVMQTIERALAIERRRDERAIYLRERTVIKLLPSLGGEFGHPCGNATCGLDRLVASPHSTGRRVGAPATATDSDGYSQSVIGSLRGQRSTDRLPTT